ncbi:hypothetical protein FVE85_2252 [Porphyridium purpureum]|uniref:Uncharacterized protein n=1 Tax=Porphyridium purpureum TaxID=35688 RepID=A0A5J4Z078_PORPP|nr:hypothetical protein FVE85_2252 [Porphyridium purpureum]|eukprot:POR4007..scf209_3
MVVVVNHSNKAPYTLVAEKDDEVELGVEQKAHHHTYSQNHQYTKPQPSQPDDTIYLQEHDAMAPVLGLQYHPRIRHGFVLLMLLGLLTALVMHVDNHAQLLADTMLAERRPHTPENAISVDGSQSVPVYTDGKPMLVASSAEAAQNVDAQSGQSPSEEQVDAAGPSTSSSTSSLSQDVTSMVSKNELQQEVDDFLARAEPGPVPEEPPGPEKADSQGQDLGTSASAVDAASGTLDSLSSSNDGHREHDLPFTSSDVEELKPQSGEFLEDAFRKHKAFVNMKMLGKKWISAEEEADLIGLKMQALFGDCVHGEDKALFQSDIQEDEEEIEAGTPAYQAWCERSGLSKTDAMRHMIQLVNNLLQDFLEEEAANNPSRDS